MKSIQTSSVSNYKLLNIGLFANVFEWYEFAIFNFLAPVIGKLFFPSDLPIIQTMQVFTFFAISYFMRPLGCLFFGLMGDQKGRRYALSWSLILVSIPTVLIGFLPTYTTWGLVGTLGLLVLRLIQGFAMGGELPITSCYVYESAHPKDRSLLCSAVGAAPKIGLLLGSFIVYLATSFFDRDSLLTWGWRIPFWLAIPLTFYIVYIRRSITETSVFVKSTLPTIKRLPPLRTVIIGCFLCVFLNVGYPILTLWMPFYLHQFLNVPLDLAQLTNTLTLAAIACFCLGTGYLVRYIGIKSLFVGSIIATLLFIIPIFKGLQSASSLGYLLSLQLVFALLVSIGQAVFQELVNDLFEPASRNLGVSLVTIIPAALFASTVPLLNSYVIYKTGWLMFPAFYIVISGLIALPAVLTLKSPSQ